MIVVTGAAGFIGSCLIAELYKRGYKDLVAVDDFSVESKKPNFINHKDLPKIDRELFVDWLQNNANQVQTVLHIGARTNTAEFDKVILDKLNLNYSKDLWKICLENGIPFLYASSAATYGLGEEGFSDTIKPVDLQPLNPYGVSKNEFDKWVLEQQDQPFFWAGFKFFNVFGPNEYHKGRMASVVMHAYNQIQTNGKVNLFKSHNPNFEDGKQLRDFIYVKDVVDVLIFMMENRPASGIYNLGTGIARSFLDLTKAVFQALELQENIEFIDTPIDIRDKYQYYTCADMQKLRDVGYKKEFTSLEEGVKEYVQQYLVSHEYYK